MGRIRKDYPKFYVLPIKHLRKTGSTYVRRLAREGVRTELASMFLAHGERADSDDKLLSDYTDRQWALLHRVVLRMRKKLLPILQSETDPFMKVSHKITPKKREEVVRLYSEGKTQKEIAELVGLHWTSVGKITRAAKKIAP
jgi:DNA-directed RNA polymerase specialized sigma24 family protein